jgi:pimeloyl-ACP methyl ester carboxylesterase
VTFGATLKAGQKTSPPWRIDLFVSEALSLFASQYGGSDMSAQDHIALSSDDVPIHYDVQGSGTIALVFVHGWCCNRGHWAGQLDHFTPHYTLVTIDLAGHGASGSDRSRWTMPSFGRDVTAVVEQLGLEQVVLIGHSMGGLVIVEAARRLPSAVIGLVGVDTWRNVEQIRTPGQIAEMVTPLRANFKAAAAAFVRARFVASSDPGLVERVVAAMSAAPPDIAIAAAEAICEYDRHLQAGLQRVNVPKVTINGRATNLEAARRLGITVMQVPGVGHFVMLEDAQAFNRLLGEALQKLTRAGALH